MALHPAYVALLAFCFSPSPVAQATGTVIVRVVSDAGPIEHATVRIGQAAGDTNAAGEVELPAVAGPAEITVERFGYGSKRATTTVKSGAPTRVVVELEAESVVSE